MALKVYIKKGRNSYKEARLVKAIEKAIAEKIEKDPNFTFTAATNEEELKRLHTEFCTEEVDFEEIESNNSDIPKKDSDAEIEGKIKDLNKMEDFDMTDPFNREEPIVRDYVLDDDGFGGDTKASNRTSYDEPTNFDDSFTIPSDEVEEAKQQQGGNSPAKQKDKKESTPFNPAFDEMSASKKRKQTKKFAAHIVEGLCTLSEKGFVMFANKDISPQKLIEYEINGEMNLDVLLTLDNNQEVTVRKWLGIMRVEAETVSKISQEERDDLSESLAEVLMEKGFAPTPMQMLGMNVGQIVLKQGLAIMQIKMTTASVLDQLRANGVEAQNSAQEEMVERAERSATEEAEEEPEQEEMKGSIEEETVETVE